MNCIKAHKTYRLQFTSARQNCVTDLDNRIDEFNNTFQS